MELNEKERNNLVKLLASENDKDVQLADKILMELNSSEEEYLELIESANEIMADNMSKRWDLLQAKIHFKYIKKQNHG